MPRLIARGDTYPPLTGTVNDLGGPVDLTAADEVKLIGKSGATTIEFVVVGLADGTWSYDIDPGDFDVVGAYNCEIQVTWNVNDIQTFPNDPDARDTITVFQDLGD